MKRDDYLYPLKKFLYTITLSFLLGPPCLQTDYLPTYHTIMIMSGGNSSSTKKRKLEELCVSARTFLPSDPNCLRLIMGGLYDMEIISFFLTCKTIRKQFQFLPDVWDKIRARLRMSKDGVHTSYQLLFHRRTVTCCSCERNLISRQQCFEVFCNLCQEQARGLRRTLDADGYLPGLLPGAGSEIYNLRRHAMKRASQHLCSERGASITLIAEWASVVSGEVPSSFLHLLFGKLISSDMVHAFRASYCRMGTQNLNTNMDLIEQQDRTLREWSMYQVLGAQGPMFSPPPSIFLRHLLPVVALYSFMPWLRLAQTVHTLRRRDIVYKANVPAFSLLLYHLVEDRDEESLVEICGVVYRANPRGLPVVEETRWAREWLAGWRSDSSPQESTWNASAPQEVIDHVRRASEEFLHPQVTSCVHSLTVRVFTQLLRHVAEALGNTAYRAPHEFLTQIVRNCVSVSKHRMSEVECRMEFETLRP